MKMDYDMVMNCITATKKDLEELERKREKLLEMGDVGRIMAGNLDYLISKKKSELANLEYALNNMT